MSLATVGAELVEDRLSRGLQIPGYGHPQHSDGDPRARQLLRICEDLGLAGDHLACLQSVGQALADRTGREPLRAPNITGAIAGILTDLRFVPETVRGLVIAARSLGLTAHIVEELQEGSKWRHAPTEQVAYVGPAAPPSDPSSPTS
jgi:citrate synthase